MERFEELWVLFRQHGSSNKREEECRALWNSYSQGMQEPLFNTVRRKKAQDKFVHYDPLRAMQENARLPREQILSYAAYYARYHTTEPRDGWQMVNPTGKQVIYVLKRKEKEWQERS